jgi:hypothetical protein
VTYDQREESSRTRMNSLQRIVASPDQQGPSSAGYVYRLTAPRKATAVSEPGESDHTLAWILLGLGLVAAVPAAAVISARS